MRPDIRLKRRQRNDDIIRLIDDESSDSMCSTTATHKPIRKPRKPLKEIAEPSSFRSSTSSSRSTKIRFDLENMRSYEADHVVDSEDEALIWYNSKELADMRQQLIQDTKGVLDTDSGCFHQRVLHRVYEECKGATSERHFEDHLILRQRLKELYANEQLVGLERTLLGVILYDDAEQRRAIALSHLSQQVVEVDDITQRSQPANLFMGELATALAETCQHWAIQFWTISPQSSFWSTLLQ